MLAVRLLMDSLKKSDPGGQAESSMVASTISDVSLPTQNGRDPKRFVIRPIFYGRSGCRALLQSYPGETERPLHRRCPRLLPILSERRMQ